MGTVSEMRHSNNFFPFNTLLLQHGLRFLSFYTLTSVSIAILVVRSFIHSLIFATFCSCFQTMLAPFTKVDLFLNIISTASVIVLWIFIFLVISIIYAFRAYHREGDMDRNYECRHKASKMRKTISLKWIALDEKLRRGGRRNENVMQLFFIHK